MTSNIFRTQHISAFKRKSECVKTFVSTTKKFLATVIIKVYEFSFLSKWYHSEVSSIIGIRLVQIRSNDWDNNGSFRFLDWCMLWNLNSSYLTTSFWISFFSNLILTLFVKSLGIWHSRFRESRFGRIYPIFGFL